MERTRSLPRRWGVLLPFTSRNCESNDDAWQCLLAFAARCHVSTISDVSVFIGLDDDDKFFAKSKMSSEDIEAKLMASWFPIAPTASVHVSHYPSHRPARICDIWRSLAKEAVNQGCFYLVLLGDDVGISAVDQVSRLESPLHWTTAVENAFQDLHLKFPTLPFGFGCVALKDVNAPSFPTFPVLTQVHAQIFPDFFPEDFVNQDADPFVFEIYRRFRAAVLTREVEITNELGGYQHGGGASYTPPRYDRQNIDWRPLLPEAVAAVERWTKRHDKSRVFRVPVIEVIVPSFRVEREFIDRIVSLTIPKETDVRFIIVVDNPDADIAWLKALCLEMKYCVRYRVHDVNQGASAARNTGLDHSCADWIVFIDDDVFPTPCLLEKYAEAIREHGRDYDGFVGWTILGGEKEPVKTANDTHHLTRYHHLGVKAAGIAFFWDAPEIMPELPWGITANLCVRYVPGVKFNEAFIRTGGGEDIDFCLKLPKQPLKAVPSAIAHHPWWNKGGRAYLHVFRWALGDSLLQKLYPQYSFYDYPNVIEVSLLVLILAVFLAAVGFKATSCGCLLICTPLLALCDMYWDWAVISSESYRGCFLSKGSWWDRLAVLVEANLHKNTVELGHMLGPLSRGHFFHAFLLRFNWFCMVMPSYPQTKRAESGKRFLCFVAIVVGAASFSVGLGPTIDFWSALLAPHKVT